MKKFLIFILILGSVGLIDFSVLFPYLTLASSLSLNRMKIGTVDSKLPEKEIRDYYAKMEPIMLKYFGPPFSNFDINIKADLSDENKDSPAEINPKTKSLILQNQARSYLEGLKKHSKEDALKVIYGTMEHELSHAMYIYKDLSVDFGGKWAYEGWARFLGDLVHSEITNIPLSISPYFFLYQDKDLIIASGEHSFRLPENQALAYEKATAAHFLLTAAASTNNLDFYKNLNSKIYDYLETKDFTPLPSGMKQPLGFKEKAALSFDEYKKIIKPLLTGVKIDGVDAYDWYFNAIEFLSDCKVGKYLWIYANYNSDNQPDKLSAFAFNRVKTAKGCEENIITNTKINVALINSFGKVILDKTIDTDSYGQIEIKFSPEEIPAGAYLASAFLKDDPSVKNKIFLIKRPNNIENKKNYLYGVLLDENNQLVNGDFVSLVKSDFDFVYKNNGLFILNVPDSVNKVVLTFLGANYEVTKGPFARVYAINLTQQQINDANSKSKAELEADKIGAQESLEKDNKINKSTEPLVREGIFLKIVRWFQNLLDFLSRKK